MNNLSPIILIVYNRLEHTEKTVESLKENTLASESILYIYSDAPRNIDDKDKVNAIRKYIHTISGFKEVHIVERKENLGLAENIIKSATEIINKYGKVILVEDDLVSSKYFLKYMNDGLEKYEENKKIGSISGYTFSDKVMRIPDWYKKDVFFFPRPSSWGWATWKDRWNQIDWKIEDYNKFKINPIEKYKFNKGGSDLTGMLSAQMNGKINSWAVRWSYNFFKKEWLSVYPTVSFIDNIGNDNTGIHSKSSNEELFKNYILNVNSEIKFPDEVFLDSTIAKNFRKIYSRNISYYIRKIKYKLGLGSK